MVDAPSTETTRLPAASFAQPYHPSWVDHLIAGIDRLPGPSWIAYGGLWFLFIGFDALLKWQAGLAPAGQFLSRDSVILGFAFISLALIQYLDQAAVDALDAMRPCLRVTDTEQQVLRYRLTTMPARPTLLAGIASVLAIVLAVVLNAGGIQRMIGFVSPAHMLFWVGMSGFNAMIAGIFLFHIIRQVWLVHHIYTRFTHINLFQLGPIYAFSGLTLRMAIIIIVITVISFLVIAGTEAQSLNSASIITHFMLTTIAIVWPVLGVHRLMEHEKARLQAEITRRIEAIIEKQHEQIDAWNLKVIVDYHSTLESLTLEHTIVSKISTWPWQPQTVASILSALFLPVILWIVTRVLERFFP